MASYCSIRQSVLEDAQVILTEQIPTTWRNTYEFTDNETIRINGVQDNPKTKVQSHSKRRQQAYEIADWMKDKVNEIYKGQVIPTIIENSIYEPITVDLTVAQEYVEHLYNKLETKRQNEPSLEITKKEPVAEVETAPPAATEQGIPIEDNTIGEELLKEQEEKDYEFETSSFGLPTINICN